jgi:hypothetical protein
MAYRVLLRLAVEHAYFADPAAASFRFAPTAQCSALLARYGILLRQEAGALAWVAQQDAADVLLAERGGGAEFEFGVYADSHFSRYTALDSPSPDACLYFHSRAAHPEAPGHWRLHAAELADGCAWQRPMPPSKSAGLNAFGRGGARPVCFMVLAADDVAAALDAGEAPRFLLRFGARKSRWKYFLLGGLQAAQASVVDLDGRLRFSARGPAALPGGASAMVFVSEQEIDMRQHHLERLQLREQGEWGERILIKRLPNASVAAVGRESAAGSAAPVLVSEIYIS